MLEYPFLILCLLLAIPAVLVVWRRPDLRRMQLHVGLLAIPFAFTETLFYPDYWEPKFLFDLVSVFGFGIEDVLFVTGLAVFSCSAWPWASANRVEPIAGPHSTAKHLTAVLGICVAMVVAIALAGFPMIWGAPAVMLALTAAMCARRPDLAGPAVQGALLVCMVYTLICLILGVLIPDVFALNWNVEHFSGISILGVPLEEYTYALATGAVATIFYPFVRNWKFVRIPGKSSDRTEHIPTPEDP